MLRKITLEMAGDIANSKAQKFLLPVNRLGIEIIGVTNEPLPHQIEKLVGSIKRVWRG
ncbi:MAG: DUF3842 family protein [Bacillota bacterium]|jgi:hypothetical protein